MLASSSGTVDSTAAMPKCSLVDLGTGLGSGETGKKERQDEGSPEDAIADRTCNRNAKSGRTKNQICGNGHGWYLVVALR